MSARALRLARAAGLLLGLLAPQVILYGPAFRGTELLLPLDVLAQPAVWFTDETRPDGLHPVDYELNDPIVEFELKRRFAVREYRAGRVPLWQPSDYAGRPFALFEKYSPFLLPYVLFPTPRALVWMHLAKVLVAGLGAYAFCRRALGLGAAAATLAACCFPLTAPFALWVHFAMTNVLPFLPWLLLGTFEAARRPRGWGGPLAAGSGALALVGGKPDVAAQVMGAGLLYGAWCLAAAGRGRRNAAAVGLLAAHALAALLTAVYLLPLQEYVEGGFRPERRARGFEERSPVGASALAQAIFPHLYGENRWDSIRFGPDGREQAPDPIRIESSAVGHAGVVLTLVLAALGVGVARRRRESLFWLGMWLFGLAWSLGAPGWVQLLRAPGLNLVSHNRWVFVSAWAAVCLAAIGFDALVRAAPRRARGWWLAPGALLLAAAALAHRGAHPPEPVATLASTVEREGAYRYVASLDQARAIRERFRAQHRAMAGTALLAAGLWTALLLVGPRSAAARRGVAGLAGLAAAGELVVFGAGFDAQAPASLDYPRIEVLARLTGSGARSLAVGALPANLLSAHGLSDVRGYDGIEPRDLVEVLDRCRSRRAPAFGYSRLQRYAPPLRAGPDGRAELCPILDMLNVRHLILPAAADRFTARFAAGGYRVVENPGALPRAFVPERVRAAPPRPQLLRALAEPSFDPSRVAYVGSAEGDPGRGPTRGTARIRAERPGAIDLEVALDAPGLLVLSERWDAGWRARLDGAEAAVVRVNGLLQGVFAPAGRHEIALRYRPASAARGLAISALAAVAWLAWTAWSLRGPVRDRR